MGSIDNLVTKIDIKIRPIVVAGVRLLHIHDFANKGIPKPREVLE